MANALQCPLLEDFASMGLIKVKDIEAHISAGNCWMFHPPLTELIFKGKLEGTTPLLGACHYGQLDSVKHIIGSWKVDVNTAAAYFPDAVTKIDRATPLFVASTNGHLGIVRFLVENGADISATTSTTNQRYDGLTPLHGAVCDLRSLTSLGEHKKLRYGKGKERAGTVRYLLESGADPSVLPSDGSPIWMMPLCGADVMKELLNHDGMSLSQRHPANGRTVLHHWIRLPENCTEFSSLAVVKMLLEKGDAKLLHVQDESGFTPLLEAVNLLKVIALDSSNKPSSKFSVLNFLLERCDIFPKEKIEAMELAGAEILRDPFYALHFPKAFEYWRRAQRLRQLESNGFGPIIKTPLKLKTGVVAEWSSSAELENVIQNPTEFMIQSFLVRLRILSTKKWKAISHFLYDSVSIGGCCSKLKKQNKYAELLDTLWAILKAVNRFDPLEPGRWDVTKKAVEYLVGTLSDIMERKDPLVTVKTIESSLELILATDQFQVAADDHMGTLLKLITMLAIRPQLVNENVMKLLSGLVRRDRRGYCKRTLLHLACKDEKNVHQFSTVHLLLEAGADRDAGDLKGNGPLHVVAKSNDSLIAQLLLDFGAQLDRVNNKGQTASDVWLEKNGSDESFIDYREEDGKWSVTLPDWCHE